MVRCQVLSIATVNNHFFFFRTHVQLVKITGLKQEPRFTSESFCRSVLSPGFEHAARRPLLSIYSSRGPRNAIAAGATAILQEEALEDPAAPLLSGA